MGNVLLWRATLRRDDWSRSGCIACPVMSMEAVITNLHECAGVDEKALKAYVDGLVMVNTTCYV